MLSKKKLHCHFFDEYVSGLEPKYIILIVGILLVVLAIIVGVGIGCYIIKWRKKNDLELLGYPPKVPASRSNLSSTSIR